VDDEETVSNFANIVANMERLEHLYLFTYGDMRAVAPNVWTEWKGTLLNDMYRRTKDYITLPDYKEQQTKFITELRQQLLSEKAQLYTADDVHRHLDSMHPNYLASTPKSVLKHHLAMINQLKTRSVVTRYNHPKEAFYPTATICTRDQLGIFAKIASILSYHKINILSAALYTRDDGIVLDTFKLKAPVSTEQWWQLNESLKEYIGKDRDIAHLFESDRKYLRLKHRGKLLVHTSITFDQEHSSQFTIMDVHTHDRKGLLYHISKTIADHQFSIQFAKIFTEEDRAIDAFYLTTPEGEKITDEHRLESLKNDLISSLRTLPED
jgi:[protein-PII] uridylyltransferase